MRGSEAVVVGRVRPADWGAWRRVRLEALADTPIGFVTRLADAEQWPDEQWQERAAAASTGEDQGLWLAWHATRAVGCTGAFRREAAPSVDVIAVYVTRQARGGDVLDRLLAAVAQWAAGIDGVRELRLDVHEDNARARAAYTRRGFVETGRTAPYAPDPTRRELEMVLPVSRER